MIEAIKLYKEVDGCFRKSYPGMKSYRKRHFKSYDFVIRHVGLCSSSSIAEIGPGHVLAMLRKRYGCSAMAFGLIDGRLKKVLDELGIESHRHDANLGDFQDEWHHRFDCVLHLDVLEHLNRWPCEVLSDAGKLLKPDGKLILSTVNFVRFSNRIRMLIGRSPLINPFVKTPDGRNHVREYTYDEFKFLCKESGLRINAFEYWQYRLSGMKFLLMPFIKLLPSMSSHMFFDISEVKPAEPFSHSPIQAQTN
jgi:SAM-dependent methyltransferase